MRKALSLFLVLLVIGIGGMLYAHATLMAAQVDISFTEVASFGDASAADGLTVSVEAQLARHMAWDSAHSFGRTSDAEREPSSADLADVKHLLDSEQKPGAQPISVTKTGFMFSSAQLEWMSQNTGEVLFLSIDSGFSGSTTGGSLLDDDLIDPAFNGPGRITFYNILRDVASRAKNNERHSESVLLRDYCEYYPVSASLMSLPNAFIDPVPRSSYNQQFAYPQTEIEVEKAFSEFFRIPVPENNRISIEVYKDSTGNVVELSASSDSPVWLNTASVNSKAGIYFTLEMVGEEGRNSIRGDYGIYLLPVSPIHDEDAYLFPPFDYHELRTVYALDRSVSVLKLDLSDDERCLNLITSEGGSLYLTVVELATMTEKQKLLLFSDVGDFWLQRSTCTDGILFMLLDNARFAVAQLNRDGIYQVELTGERNAGLLQEKSLESGYYRWYDTNIAWNGERLAIVTENQRFIAYDDGYSNGYPQDSCGFVIEIYDESGLRYKALFESSLDVLASRQYDKDWCRLIDSGGLSVNW